VVDFPGKTEILGEFRYVEILKLATFGLAPVGAATGSYLCDNRDTDWQNTPDGTRAVAGKDFTDHGPGIRTTIANCSHDVTSRGSIDSFQIYS
jgi:hypothetical protein